MNKSDTIHMRIEPDIKAGADSVLNRLGMSTAEAISIFLNQVILRGGLPFDVKIPEPNAATLKAMSDAENGVDLHKFDSAEEMFRELGI